MKHRSSGGFRLGWANLRCTLSAHHSPLPLLLQLSGLVLDGLAEVLLRPLLPLGRVQVGLQLNTHTHQYSWHPDNVSLCTRSRKLQQLQQHNYSVNLLIQVIAGGRRAKNNIWMN